MVAGALPRGSRETMKTTTIALAVAALALLALPTAVDAATATAYHATPAGRVECIDNLPEPLYTAWLIACTTLAQICLKTDLCR